MAANVLPRLSVSGQRVGSGEPRTQQLPALAPARPRARQIASEAEPSSLSSGGRPARRGLGAKDKQQKRALAKDINPASYRHSVFHNICTEMLEKGFHKSFSELFDLVQCQKAEHERAGPAAVLLEPLIHCDHPKLEYLRVQLTAAEDADRAGDLERVYVARRSLAQYFEKNQGQWLAVHFYRRGLEVAERVSGDSQRAEGEAQCSIGLALERKGDLLRAREHLEAYHRLAHKWNWSSESGESVYEIACEHLRRVFTAMAKQVEAENIEEAISLLKKAHEMARDSRNSTQEGLACYRLGQAHQMSGDIDMAIQYHRKYLEWCKYHKHNEGAGNAYEALSKCYEKKGDVDMAVKQLELYVEVAESVGAKARATGAIGAMYNTLGDYEKSVEFFGRCYELCSQLGDPVALHEARVQYGIARGNQLFQSFAGTINTSSSTGESLEQLIAWKDERTSVTGSMEDLPATTREKNEEQSNKEEGGGADSEERVPPDSPH